MVISYKNRYIYIAVPKTGTTSIQKLLLEQDSSARNYGIEIEGKKYNFGEHDSAQEIRTTLGELYPEFRTFGFIRNPYSRIVSSYFFYKQGGKRLGKRNKKRISRELKIQSAKILPFKLWALLYPYKSNIQHFMDENNNLIVDFIGTFENMEEDLTKILGSIGLNISTSQLQHSNKSNHSSYSEYFTNKTFEKAVSRIIRGDLEFYEEHKFNL